jgi:hypothetical protein
MEVGNLASSCEEIEFRQQAHYWQAQHKRTIARESQLQAKVRSLEDLVHAQMTLNQEQGRQIEALTAKVVFLQQQIIDPVLGPPSNGNSHTRPRLTCAWIWSGSVEGCTT